MHEENRSVSLNLENDFKAVSYKLYKYSLQFEDSNERFSNDALEFLIMSKLAEYGRVTPSDIYNFFDGTVCDILLALFPRDVTSVPGNHHLNFALARDSIIHFSGSFPQTIPKLRTGDYRAEEIGKLKHLRSCYDERLADGRMNIEIYDILLELQEIQYLCLEELADFNRRTPEWYDIMSYVDISKKLVKHFINDFPHPETLISMVVQNYDADLTLMSTTDLEEDTPEGLSPMFTIIMASNGLLRFDYPRVHYDLCKAWRLTVFQTTIPEVNPGKYLAHKKEAYKGEDAISSFENVDDELEFRVVMIQSNQDALLQTFCEAWKSDSELSYRLSIVQLYATTSLAYEVLTEAKDELVANVEEGEDYSNKCLALIYQALFIQISGLQTVAKTLLPPNISQLLDPYISFPKETTDDFMKKFGLVFNIFESNFRVVREKYPELADAVFESIEICKILNHTLYLEFGQDELISLEDAGRWQAAIELYNFVHYLYRPMDEIGAFCNIDHITILIEDAIRSLVHIFDSSSLLDRSFSLMNIFLVESSFSRNSDNWTSIFKEIPLPYKSSRGRSRNFTLRAIVKRWAKSLEPKGAQEKINAQDIDTIVADLSPQNKSRAAKKKSKIEKGKSKKQKHRRRGSNNSKDSTKDVDEVVEEVEEIEDRQVGSKTDEGEKRENPECSSEKPSEEQVVPVAKPLSVWKDVSTPIEAKLDEKKEEEDIEPGLPPTHFMPIVKSFGYSKVDADPRDIAFALLVVGDRIWRKHLEPLMEAFEEADLGLLIQLFKYSIDKFEQEIYMLETEDSDLFDRLLQKSNMKDSDHLGLCLKYYKQRLAVAHPHVPRVKGLRSALAAKHLTVLEYYEDIRVEDIETWRQRLDCHEEIFVEQISLENRPERFVDIDFTEYVLALLGIQEICPLERLVHARNSVAHHQVSDATFSAYLEFIFRNNPDYDFLYSLLG